MLLKQMMEAYDINPNRKRYEQITSQSEYFSVK